MSSWLEQVWEKNKLKADESIDNGETDFMINYSEKSFAFMGKVKDFAVGDNFPVWRENEKTI